MIRFLHKNYSSIVQLSRRKNIIIWKRFKGGGGASRGGGGGFSSSMARTSIMSSRNTFRAIIPGGYRVCKVCNLLNQECLVPISKGPVSSCEAKGEMCDTARKLSRDATVSKIFIFGCAFFAGCMYLHSKSDDKEQGNLPHKK